MSLPMRTVFSALVLRPLRREPGRTLLTILGIGVGVAVVVAIQLANRSAIRSFEETVDAVAGRANYQLTASAGTMNQNLLLELQPFWREGVRFAPVIDRDAVLTDSSQPVRILAVDLLSDLHFRDYRFARVAGSERDAPGAVQSWYLALFANRSAIIPAPLASRMGLRIGDRVPVTLDGSSSPFVIRATLESEGPATAFDGAIMIMDIHVAQTSFPELEGKLSRIDLIVPDQDPRLLESIRSILPRGVELERPSRRAERVDQMLQAFRVNLIALASVSLIVGIFLVYNTVLVSVLRRRGMIGTMRTLGVGSMQIFLSFLCEGLLFGLLGSIAGLGIGLYLARGILDLVSRTVSTLYVRTAPSAVELTPDVILTAVITGAVVALLAALQPAAEAARVRPLTLLRESRFARLRPRRITFMALGGTVCLVTAWFVSKLPPVGSISVGGYGAVLFVIIGFSLLSPLTLQKLALLAKKPLRRLFSVPGELAAASMPASLRRTAIAAAALLIAIAMMVAVSLMIGSFRSTVSTWVEQTVSSDIWLRPARNLDSAVASFPEQITRDLEKLDFVEAWDPFRGREILLDGMPFLLGSGDFETLIRFGRLPMIDPPDKDQALMDALRSDGAVVSESLAMRLSLQTGDVVELPTPDGSRSVPITGIYRDYSSDRGIIVVDRSLYVDLYDDRAIDTIGIFLQEGVDPEEAKRRIEEALSVRWNAFAFTNQTIRREVLKVFDQTFVVTWALLGIALTVAILGIVSTLSAMIIERRREIALLRVSGMTQREVRQMVVLEASILGVTSTILGAVCGYLLSLILIFVINKQSFGWTISFSPPWGILAISLLVTFLATIAAGLLASSLADRLKLSRAIQAE